MITRLVLNNNFNQCFVGLKKKKAQRSVTASQLCMGLAMLKWRARRKETCSVIIMSFTQGRFRTKQFKVLSFYSNFFQLTILIPSLESTQCAEHYQKQLEVPKWAVFHSHAPFRERRVCAEVKGVRKERFRSPDRDRCVTRFWRIICFWEKKEREGRVGVRSAEMSSFPEPRSLCVDTEWLSGVRRQRRPFRVVDSRLGAVTFYFIYIFILQPKVRRTHIGMMRTPTCLESKGRWKAPSRHVAISKMCPFRGSGCIRTVKSHSLRLPSGYLVCPRTDWPTDRKKSITRRSEVE